MIDDFDKLLSPQMRLAATPPGTSWQSATSAGTSRPEPVTLPGRRPEPAARNQQLASRDVGRNQMRLAARNRLAVFLPYHAHARVTRARKKIELIDMSYFYHD